MNNTENAKCPVCECNANNYSCANYPNPSSILIVPIFYCRNCNTFFKDIDDKLIQEYSESPMWTKPTNEDLTFISRIHFYEYIYSLVEQYNNTISRWVDWGCSYGHFVDYLKKSNIISYGVDLSNEAIVSANEKGLIVFKYIEDLPKNKKFDVISLIDSIYYLKTPKNILKVIHNKLNENGLIIIRISNRNWRIKFNKYVLRKKTDTLLIDHIIGFSKQSIVYLLKEAEFEILKTTSIERGKTRPPKTKYLWYFYYYLSLFLAFITIGSINLSPGIIIIAKKNGRIQ